MSRPDVTVTNQKDKETQLPKLFKLQESIIKIGAALPAHKPPVDETPLRRRSESLAPSAGLPMEAVAQHLPLSAAAAQLAGRVEEVPPRFASNSPPSASNSQIKLIPLASNSLLKLTVVASKVRLEGRADGLHLARLFPPSLATQSLSTALQPVAALQPSLAHDRPLAMRALAKARELQGKHPSLSLDELAALCLYTIEGESRERCARRLKAHLTRLPLNPLAAPSAPLPPTHPPLPQTHPPWRCAWLVLRDAVWPLFPDCVLAARSTVQ